MARESAATVFVICGPTASGKSGLALALAEALGGTVINADSMQVYRGLEILTAQPDARARARAPHALYGVLDAADPCSAGRWRDMALAAIAAARQGGRVPLVVGGSGLYLKALMEGIAPVPEIPPDLRARLRARLAAVGTAAFHAELAARDPAGAAAIRPSDPQRMIRAMEVIEATGTSLRDWQACPPDGPPQGMAFRTILLDPPRAALHAAIADRFARMVKAGAPAEARALAARGLDPALPAMKALGLAELAAVAAGRMALDAAVAKAETATRQYAKRQGTWFRGQMIADFRYSEQFSESLYERIIPEII